MNQQGYGQHQVSGVVSGTNQPSYSRNVYTAQQMPGVPSQGSFGPRPPTGQTSGTQYQAAYHQQMHHHQQMYYHQQQQQEQLLQQNLQCMLANKYEEFDKLTYFNNHSLPMVRIRKIMKADEEVNMISAEVPIVFVRACELFIMELSMRAWYHAMENNASVLQRDNIAGAIARTELFNFLGYKIPMEDPRNAMPVPVFAGSQSGYYMPPDQQLPYAQVPEMNMSNPQMDPFLYNQQFHQNMAPYMQSEAPQQVESIASFSG